MSESLNNNILYPGSSSHNCDPIYSAGFADFAEVELCSAKPAGYLSDSFWGYGNCSDFSVVENKIGLGQVITVTSTNYPGNLALYPLYRALVREVISASSRNCNIKVIGSDRVRYAVYDGGKMYILNTCRNLHISKKKTTQLK